MAKFENYYLSELAYLKELQKLVCDEKPHLADILSGHDPDVERLNEGFAVFMARIRQKNHDAFPEIVLELLQRLESQNIKGIPATSVVQLNRENGAIEGYSLPGGIEIQSDTGMIFTTSWPCDIAPLTLIRRTISKQAQETHITLTFKYTGKEESWRIRPVSLFLSPDETVADTLMFSLLQYCDDIVFSQEGCLYPMPGIRLEPLSGASRLVLSSLQDTENWARC
ncbi:conserved hypothetical protein [Xenorhabdus nematophila str. Anatoliense]|nr:conserved hypothetical protein [Xenorhabdus nematophila str. Anatoliense]